MVINGSGVNVEGRDEHCVRDGAGVSLTWLNSCEIEVTKRRLIRTCRWNNRSCS